MLYKLAGVLGVTVDEIVNASKGEENPEVDFLKSQLEELKQRRRKLELIYLISVIALPITAFLFSYFILIIYCKIFNISLNSSYNQDILSVALIIGGILFVLINMSIYT